MAPSADFLTFLQDQLRGLGTITSRRMFSGAGLYCDGLIFALIGRRLQARKHHFMLTSLLESQFTVLEEPQAEERALTVSIAMSPRRVVGTIIERLGLEVPPGGA